MREVLNWSVFILLFIGTFGLIFNEFIFSWGRTATLAFAAVNVAGLAIFAFVHWGMKKET